MRSGAKAPWTMRAATASIAIALAVYLAAAASAAASPITSTVQQSAAVVRAYWTPQRMLAAKPASLLEPGPLDLTGAQSGSSASSGQAKQVSRTRSYPNRTNGKVFFTIPVPAADAGDYECSGTAVRSHTGSLVWTAGHCGYDPGQFPLACDCTVRNFEFVPAYNNGSKPYGEWPAKRIANPSQWRNSGDSAFDFTAATVRTRSGRRLEDVIGARRIAFGQPRRVQYRAFGYPDEPPFDGEHLYRCASGYRGQDNSEGPPRPIRIACDMTAGSSGGGWVIRRRHRGHFRHYVVSLTSYGYLDDPGFLYGPYQGGVAKALYRSAAG
jgi:V8-like Glu-specific endopeptidase